MGRGEFEDEFLLTEINNMRKRVGTMHVEANELVEGLRMVDYKLSVRVYEHFMDFWTAMMDVTPFGYQKQHPEEEERIRVEPVDLAEPPSI
jgi:hypothetical protein